MFGHYNKNGKGTIYAHPPLFIPSFFCCGDIDHTRKHSKVEPHISTTKKDNEILRRNSLPLLSQINITKPINYPLANVGGDTF